MEAPIANKLDGNEPKSTKTETSVVENNKKVEGRLSPKQEGMVVNAEVHTESENIPA